MAERQPKYLSARDIGENPDYPFSHNAAKKMVNQREDNGLGRYMIRLGTKLYVREDHFQQWLESNKEKRDRYGYNKHGECVQLTPEEVEALDE